MIFIYLFIIIIIIIIIIVVVVVTILYYSLLNTETASVYAAFAGLALK